MKILANFANNMIHATTYKSKYFIQNSNNMKIRKFLIIGTAFMALGTVSCKKDSELDPDDNPIGPGGNGTMEVYTPEKSKEFLQDTATEFMGLFNSNDQKEILELSAYFVDTFEYYDFPEQFYGDEEVSYSPKNYLKYLSSAMRGNLDDLTRASYIYTYNINFDRYAGVYEPNSKKEEWVCTEKSNDIVFKFKDAKNADCELRVSKSGGNSDFSFDSKYEDSYDDYYYSEEYIFNLSIPNTVKAELKLGGKTLATSTVTSKIDLKGNKIEADATADAANIKAVASVRGNDTKIACTAEFVMDGSKKASSYATLNGSGLCDTDRITSMINSDDEDELARMFSNGVCGANVLDKVQIYAQMTYNRELTDCLDGYWDSYDYNSKSEAKNDCQKACETLNKYIEAQLRYNNTSTNQATIKFQPYLDEWDYGWGEPRWEYYVEPVLLFGDGTTYSFEEYFSKFNTVENKWGTLIDSYERIWENAMPSNHK